MIDRRGLLRLLTALAALGWLPRLPRAADDGWASLPAESATIERIAFGSCADQRLPQPFWDVMLAAAPQLVILLGDNVYGDVTSAAMTELREAYAKLAAQPGFQRLRRRVPILAIWDDHDYGGNDAGGDFPYRQEAATLFRDFWQVPANSPRGRRDGLYEAWMFGPQGRRLQVVLLDTRSFRSPLRRTDERGVPGKERYLPDPDPAKALGKPAAGTGTADPADRRNGRRGRRFPLRRPAPGRALRADPGCAVYPPRSHRQFLQQAVPPGPRARSAATKRYLQGSQLRDGSHRLADPARRARTARRGRRRCPLCNDRSLQPRRRIVLRQRE
jgi:PhoD-like phosphatase